MSNVRELIVRVDNSLKEVVPYMVTSTTNWLMKDNLPWHVVDVVKKKKERTKADNPTLVSQEFVAHAPQMIKELFRTYMQNAVLNMHSTLSASNALIPYLQHQFTRR
nr:hypothetical protein [Tanacetum cinerariifolium]